MAKKRKAADDGGKIPISDMKEDVIEKSEIGEDASVEDQSSVPAESAAEEAVDAVEAESEEAAESDFDDDAEEDKEDTYLKYLTSEYHKWRLWTLILAILGFSIVLISIGLSQANIINLKVFNLMMSVANLFIVMMLVFAFTRTRPYRKKIRSYDKYYVSIIDHDAKDGVRIEQRQLPDMDDFFKIFERGVRTELIPETEEYKSLRKTWILLYILAAVALVVAVALYLAIPDASLIATLILLAAFVLVIVAFYFDRTKMRPIRVKWARDKYGMSEFQVRDRMNENR